MKNCNDYEIELSALLDGESSPAMALRLVDHVASCSGCSEFVRGLRSTQSLIDSLQLESESVPGEEAVGTIVPRQKRFLGLRPQWAIGLAALLIVSVSIWFGTDVGTPNSLTNDIRDGELNIRLEEHKGRMSDERFFALVSELLQADRRYQNEMYVVLDEIRIGGESGESRRSDDTRDAGESDDLDLTSFSPQTAAME